MDGRAVRIQRNRGVDANGDSENSHPKSRGSGNRRNQKYNRSNNSESEKILYQREYNNSNSEYSERPSSGRGKEVDEAEGKGWKRSLI